MTEFVEFLMKQMMKKKDQLGGLIDSDYYNYIEDLRSYMEELQRIVSSTFQ